MLKALGAIISFFLIFIIFIRTPEDSEGLAVFSSQTRFLGSSRRFIDLVTAAAIILYLIIAFNLNLANTEIKI